MAVAVLPPGNKFKILSSYEIVQLAEVIKSSKDFEASITILEQKWKKGSGVYDIDLISVAVPPLSGWGKEGRRRQEMAQELQKGRKRRGVQVKDKPNKKRPNKEYGGEGCEKEKLERTQEKCTNGLVQSIDISVSDIASIECAL